MNARALVVVLAFSLAMPALAQDTVALDAPTQCPPGSVVLAPDVALATAKRLAAAEAAVKVYEAHPPFPWWAAVIVGVVAAGVGAGVTVGIYEAVRARP